MRKSGLGATGWLVIGLLTACGGAVNGRESEGSAAGSAVAGSEASAGSGGEGAKPLPGSGGAATGGSAATGGAEPVAGAGGTSACASRRDEAPGEPVYSEMEFGAGDCGKVSLAQVLRAIELLRPDLSDVTTLYAPDPNRGGDGSFKYAFRKPDGGFAVVVKRGSGDCPSGCIVNDYWYFETGADCEVVQVGESHRGGDGCMPADQLPRWGIPRSPPPAEVCDADLSPQDLHGTYSLVTCGQSDASCFLDKDRGTGRSLPESIRLNVQQDAADPSHGLVIFEGTEQPGLDGVPFEATFERMKVAVSDQSPEQASTCVEHYSLEFVYDFEGLGERRLSFSGAHTPDCASAPENYCKFQATAAFGEATRLP